MRKETIIKILDLHSVPHYERDGEIYADSAIGGTALFQEVENVTDWSKRKLYDWLGYDEPYSFFT